VSLFLGDCLGERVLFKGRALRMGGRYLLTPGIALVTQHRLVFHSLWECELVHLGPLQIREIEPSWRTFYPSMLLRANDGSELILSALQPFKFRDAVMQMLPLPTPSMLIFLPAKKSTPA